MIKTTIAVVVGGLLVFIWQVLSIRVLDLHRSAQMYHPQQDTILNFLDAHLSEEGRYFLPTLPKGASPEDREKLYRQALDKPWAVISYHYHWQDTTIANGIRTLLTDIFVVWLLYLLLYITKTTTAKKIFLVSVIAGFFAFSNEIYTEYIWTQEPGLFADLTDSVIGWSACGLWLGWYLPRNNSAI